MLASSPADSPAVLLFPQAPPAPRAPALELWRLHRCPADCQRPTLALSWVLAISLACLSVSLIGLRTPVKQPLQLLSMASAPQGEDTGELAMLEMSAPPPEAQSETTPSEAALDLALPEPNLLPETLPDPLEDLPDLAEVLTADDLFEIPAAPPVEEMLTPATPRRAEPPPASTPRRSTAPATASRSPSTGAATGSSGGTGGTGTSSRGSSKGYFPSPPYPAAARSRGMQGTVYLSITFSSDGSVSSASVSRSSGYSELDRAASDWVRRRWRGPAGQAGTFRQPVQFRLR